MVTAVIRNESGAGWKLKESLGSTGATAPCDSCVESSGGCQTGTTTRDGSYGGNSYRFISGHCICLDATIDDDECESYPGEWAGIGGAPIGYPTPSEVLGATPGDFKSATCNPYYPDDCYPRGCLCSAHTYKWECN